MRIQFQFCQEMDSSIKFAICLCIFTFVRYSSGEKGEYITGMLTPCGSVQVVSKNDIYTISDLALAKSVIGFTRQIKRFRRSIDEFTEDDNDGSIPSAFAADDTAQPRPPLNFGGDNGQWDDRHLPDGHDHSKSSNPFVNTNPFQRGRFSQASPSSYRHSSPVLFSSRRGQATIAPAKVSQSFRQHMESRFGKQFKDENRKFPKGPVIYPSRFSQSLGHGKKGRRRQGITLGQRNANRRRFLMSKNRRDRMMGPDHRENPNSLSSPKHMHSINNSSATGKKLPLLIEHILDSEYRRNPESFKKATPDNKPNVGGPRQKSNPHDLLASLGPEKLDQLKKLLNSPSGAPNNEMSRGGPRFRKKRNADSDADLLQEQFPNELNSPSGKIRHTNSQIERMNKPQKCNWTFRKGPNCQRLVVKFLYIVDGGRNCKEEYLRVSGENKTQTFCEQSHLDSRKEPFSTEEKITIQHFKKPGGTPYWETKFKGIVLCEQI